MPKKKRKHYFLHRVVHEEPSTSVKSLSLCLFLVLCLVLLVGILQVVSAVHQVLAVLFSGLSLLPDADRPHEPPKPRNFVTSFVWT